MLDTITSINSAINNVVWGWPALILLSFAGILMTCLTKFLQVTHIGHWMKETIGAIFRDKNVTGHTKDKSISQFQSLCTALAATVGTGNIVGVAGAIMVGGPGAVFWMWIIAFFGMMTNYSEMSWESITAKKVLPENGTAARCIISKTVWVRNRAAKFLEWYWLFCFLYSASWHPLASAI